MIAGRRTARATFCARTAPLLGGEFYREPERLFRALASWAGGIASAPFGRALRLDWPSFDAVCPKERLPALERLARGFRGFEVRAWSGAAAARETGTLVFGSAELEFEPDFSCPEAALAVLDLSSPRRAYRRDGRDDLALWIALVGPDGGPELSFGSADRPEEPERALGWAALGASAEDLSRSAELASRLGRISDAELLEADADALSRGLGEPSELINI